MTVTWLLTSGEKVTARKVKEKCELDVNVPTVQRTLLKIDLKYAKKKITLTKKHKGARVSILCDDSLDLTSSWRGICVNCQLKNKFTIEKSNANTVFWKEWIKTETGHLQIN